MAWQKKAALVAFALFSSFLVSFLVLRAMRGNHSSHTYSATIGGHLVNKATGQSITDTVVTVVGDGLSERTPTGPYGNFSVDSQGPPGPFSVMLIVFGYRPYRLVAVRQEIGTITETNCYQCNRPQTYPAYPVKPDPPILLTPVPLPWTGGCGQGTLKPLMDAPTRDFPTPKK